MAKYNLKNNFYVNYPYLSSQKVINILQQNNENKKWLKKILQIEADKYNLLLPDNILNASDILFQYLIKISFAQADTFVLNSMMTLKNRYEWTFSTNAKTLEEQIQMEAKIVVKAWNKLFKMSLKNPVFVILNETTPTDYMTCSIPYGASIFNKSNKLPSDSIMLYTGLKISSSEHRQPLYGTPEGKGLEKAVLTAQYLGRTPVLFDFSRRRFPRSFMRAAHFAQIMGWGIKPQGKVYDSGAEKIPKSKSARGFNTTNGHLNLIFYDPWPVSDPDIIKNLTIEEKASFCNSPQTKPWQDDRIGARKEMEMENGKYKITANSWIIPTPGGWAYIDDIFKNCLAEFVTLH